MNFQGLCRIVDRTPPQDDQGVLVCLKLADAELGYAEEFAEVERLEEQIRSLLAVSGAGEYDGREVDGGFFRMFMYGEDADGMCEAIMTAILYYPALPGSYMVKRYGGPGAPETCIQLYTPLLANSRACRATV